MAKTATIRQRVLRKPRHFAWHASRTTASPGGEATQHSMKIRDVIRLLHDDGWVLVAQVGSHRPFKHRSKSGRVTVAGHEWAELKPKTLNSVLKQAGLK